MLTEQEVARTWRQMFNRDTVFNEAIFERAETLLEELRAESPLRLRLNNELDELRRLQRS